MMRAIVAGIALLLASCAAVPPQPMAGLQPEIAITIDDLPVHAPYPPGVTPNQVNDQMVAELKAAGIPVIGFVNGIGVEQHPETIQALRDWRAAGLLLGNHTWSHPHLSQISVADFEQELTKNEPILVPLNGTTDWRLNITPRRTIRSSARSAKAHARTRRPSIKSTTPTAYYVELCSWSDEIIVQILAAPSALFIGQCFG